MIKSLVKMNENNQWLSRNQATIIKCYQVFFWSGLILYVEPDYILDSLPDYQRMISM